MTGVIGKAVNGNGVANGHAKEEVYTRPNFLSEAVRGRDIDGSEW